MKKVRLSRRTVLRGLGGVAVGLPVLECMLDNHGEALAQSVPLPKRYAIVFAGQALGGDDWADNTSIVPASARPTRRRSSCRPRPEPDTPSRSRSSRSPTRT